MQVRSESSRVLTIFDIPEATARQLLEILRNDLKEYESLDDDFGPGAETAVRAFVGELEKHLPPKK